MTAILDVHDLSIAFGGLKAVDGFSLQVPAGGLNGLIGPNGAGKTTVFNLLTGVYQPNRGRFALQGAPLNGMRPFQIAAAGVARTFQNIRLFPDLSVLDNVRTACHLRSRSGLFSTILRTPRQVGEERAITAFARELLDVLGLLKLEREQARNLPYGYQRLLEIARALATRPKLLLLDEPAAGMNSSEKRALRTQVRTIREQFKLAILLIEHDMGVVMDICERITVLDYGQVIASGSPKEIQENPKVIEAYLGTPAELPVEAKV